MWCMFRVTKQWQELCFSTHARRAFRETVVRFAAPRCRIVNAPLPHTVLAAALSRFLFLFAREQLPQFVVYREITYSSRFYMQGVTAIDPDWLPELSAGSLCLVAQ